MPVDEIRALADRLAILEVIAAFSYAADAKDADGRANLFAEDALHEIYDRGKAEPRRSARGRENIRRWFVEAVALLPSGFQGRHYQTGTVFFELTEETARTRTMVLYTIHSPGDAKAHIDVTGIYDDDWRRTESGWQFAARLLHRD